ncbi:hypothetical protein MUN89_17865 [Halobacillus salinarum]|uniref:Uncharacterized protein n=1 Tax=Halobacillus salinarum TaxID=2932257 RepID=A0ABY4EHV9_9BACI|nr:hypothetical protein [Halobacillus salinarum]UOQ43729.1 hypothetical protein MUN89_17865 [Halobacillus salinarum]
MSTAWISIIVSGALNVSFLVIYFLTLRENKKMVTETREMTEEARLTRAQSYRPEVFVYIREVAYGLYFTIENIGTRPAFDVYLTLEPLFSTYTQLEGHTIFFKKKNDRSIRNVEKSIKVIAPDQKFESYVGLRPEILKEGEDTRERETLDRSSLESPVKITYLDSEKLEYKDEYLISLYDFAKIEGTREAGLGDITNELARLRTEISKIRGER